jgi:MEMO1 family protein
MLTKILVILIFSFFSARSSAEEVMKPVVAGSFYPAEPAILAAQVDKYLKEAAPPAIDGDIIALICPHAGYEYSGPVAAYGYKLISDRKFDTVVIIGISHHLAFDGVSILEKGFYETPLGNVPVDSEFTNRLMKHKKDIIYFEPRAFKDEHSMEVQIPFLQRSLKDFKIVPLIMGKPDYKTCKVLARALAEAIKDGNKKVLIVASTDLSHRLTYRDAITKDQVTLSEIMRLDAERFAVKVSEGECELCGSGPVITALFAGRELGANRVKVLRYANSGDTAGDKSRVVGYASVAIYREEENMLSAAQKKRLIEIARKTIEAYVKEGKITEFKEDDPALLKVQGAFVTLHKASAKGPAGGGALRGCIGNIIGQEPLYLTIRDMAIESSTRDPRFSSVTASELKDIKIEISVLSEPKAVTKADEITMGAHGVILKQGFRSAVYLPQVAAETGWTREEFLSNLCLKAGLSRNAWKEKDTQLLIFTAQVFEEDAP